MTDFNDILNEVPDAPEVTPEAAQIEPEAVDVTLGQAVTYIGSNGKQKVAFVLGTRDSITEGTDVPRPAANQANLMVFSPSGRVYLRNQTPVATDDEQTNVFQV